MSDDRPMLPVHLEDLRVKIERMDDLELSFTASEVARKVGFKWNAEDNACAIYVLTESARRLRAMAAIDRDQ